MAGPRQLLKVLFALMLALVIQAQLCSAEVSDPLEPVNRKVFWFNDQVDTYFFEPIAKGYKWILPKPVRTGVGNFFVNIKSPIYVVSDLVQLKFTQVGLHSGRFLINSSLGVLGIIDIAKEFGLEHEKEDFGAALGYHGVPEGPFLVLPFLGPSNTRDFFGRIVDMFLNPLYYFGDVTDNGDEIGYPFTALEAIDDRARLIEAVRSAREASVDYYSFVKNSFHQHRQNIIYDNNPPEESTDADEVE